MTYLMARGRALAAAQGAVRFPSAWGGGGVGWCGGGGDGGEHDVDGVAGVVVAAGDVAAGAAAGTVSADVVDVEVRGDQVTDASGPGGQSVGAHHLGLETCWRAGAGGSGWVVE